MKWLTGWRRPKVDTQAIGQAGENQALDYLQERGFRLIERNFRSKFGEIDLIMQQDHPVSQIVFVEVRLRASAQFGGAQASVTPAKQRRLLLTAQWYLQRFSTPPRCRFDLVAIENGQIVWLQDIIAAA